MADNGMHRQLKAIFSTDVKGYSKLMGEDDTFTAFRNIFATLIGKHRGVSSIPLGTTFWLNLTAPSMPSLAPSRSSIA